MIAVNKLAHERLIEMYETTAENCDMLRERVKQLELEVARLTQSRDNWRDVACRSSENWQSVFASKD